MSSKELIPSAEYTSPDLTKRLVPGPGPHSTDGKTTSISEIVTNAGGIDRDKPSVAKNTSLGMLREQLTTLQDNVNAFLTDRMQQQQKKIGDENSLENDDIERRLLDEGVDEDSD